MEKNIERVEKPRKKGKGKRASESTSLREKMVKGVGRME